MYGIMNGGLMENVIIIHELISIITLKWNHYIP